MRLNKEKCVNYGRRAEFGAGGTRRRCRDTGCAPRARLPSAPTAAPARQVATTLRATLAPRVAAALARPGARARETESGRWRRAAPALEPLGALGPPARWGWGRPGRVGAPRGPRPHPRSLFRAVQQDPGEAALAAAHGDQQRAVDDLLHPHRQPAAGPRLHAPAPRPGPRAPAPAPPPPPGQPARDAARRPPDVTKLRSGRPP